MSAITIGIFERPGADFVLRRALELVSDRDQARQALANPSRFVVMLREPEGVRGVFVDDLEAVFQFLAAFKTELGPDSPPFELRLAVSPESKAEIDTAIGDARAIAGQ